jgi:lipopolysaccharide transport system ATP-binding protein
MSLLVVRGLGKSYKTYHSEFQRIASWFYLPSKPREEHWILQDINFTINPGETIGIVGQNGAGKSTLLKMITGTLQPSEGTVEIHGRIAAILELGMGFNPELTGRANVMHSAGLMGFSTSQIEGVMAEIETFAEIGTYFDEPVRTYSSGMQMRVGFAVATAFRPDILIVDEALSVGDAYFQAKCYKRIADFKEQGTALVLVSHSPGDVVKHCERAIMLKGGRVEMDGNSRDVTNRYLDELFGKRKKVAGGDEPFKEKPSVIMEMGAADEFHTRPGYRAQEYRWGQGGAQILDYVIVSGEEQYPSLIVSNSHVDFYFKVRFDSDFESVVPGFLIKTIEGIFLYGTNSILTSENRDPITAREGDFKVFRFSLPVSLFEGHYLLSFGISSGFPVDELVPLDRRYDAVMIQVSRSVSFSGIIDLQAGFAVCEESVEEEIGNV